MALFELRRYEEAEKAFALALDGSSDDAHAHQARALCLCNLERRQEGRHEAEEAIRLDPESWQNHFALAACLAGLSSAKDWPTCAEQAIRETLRFAPNDADTWGLLAFLRSIEQRWSEMLDAANQGLSHDAHHVNCLLHRAEALFAINDLEGSESSAQQVLQIDAGNSRAFACLGRIRFSQRRMDESQGHFLEALRIRPLDTDAQARMRRGQSRWRRWLEAGDELAGAHVTAFFPQAHVKTPESVADAQLLASDSLRHPQWVTRASGQLIRLWIWLPRVLRPRGVDEVTSVTRFVFNFAQAVVTLLIVGTLLLFSWPEIPEHRRVTYCLGILLLLYLPMTLGAFLIAIKTRNSLYRQLACLRAKHTFIRFKH